MADKNAQQFCNLEQHKLICKLQSELRQDFARIYNDSLFCDIELAIGNTTVYANCCVLKVRAAHFFSELRSIQQTQSGCCELDFTAAESITSFVRNLYLKDTNKTSENTVVKFLQQAKESPRFEDYVTPLTSPSQLNFKENHRSNSLYYSIVPVDWERELAEQDFLLASFRSLFKRDQKLRKQKCILNPLRRSRYSTNSRHSSSLLNLKQAVKEDSILLSEEYNSTSPEVLLNFFSGTSETNSKVLFQCRFFCSDKKDFNEESDEATGSGYFDAEDEPTLLMQNEILSGFHFSQNTKGFAMESAAESDLSESADQGRGHEASESAIVSDCGMWSPTSSLKSWMENAPSNDSVSNADFVDRVLEELVEETQKQTLDNQENIVVLPDAHLETSLAAKPHCFINAASLLDETEIQSSSTVEGIDFKDDALGSFEVLMVRDDDCDGKESSSNQESVSMERVMSDSSTSETLKVVNDSKSLAFPASTDLYVQSSPSSAAFSSKTEVEETDTGSKPSSLIRSNTFELEAEDDKLALLRQEYERRQGNMIFHSCVPQCSGPLSDGSSEHDQHQHCTSLTLNNDLSSLAEFNFISSLPVHIVEDDVHTPDSLNSDAPDVIFQEPRAAEPAKTEVENMIDVNTSGIKSLDLNENKSKEFDSSLKNDYDSLPVVSGGVSVTCKEVQSPLFSRRKTESAPILSGAAPPFPVENTHENKPKPFPKISMSSAWVVDISDITKSPEPSRRKKNEVLTASACEAKSDESKVESSRGESRSLTSSLGFFIDLSNPINSNTTHEKPLTSFSNLKEKTPRKLSDSGRGMEYNCRSESKGDEDNAVDQGRDSRSSSKLIHSPEKKLFTMFIGIGDQVTPKAKPELSSSSKPSNSSVVHKHPVSGDHSVRQAKCKTTEKYACTSAASKQNTGKNGVTMVHDSHAEGLPCESDDSGVKKGPFYIFRNSDSLDTSQNSLRSTFSHSKFGSELKHTSAGLRSQHQRTQSLSMDKTLTSRETGLNILSKTSRQWSTQSLHNNESNIDDKTALKPMFSSLHAPLSIEECKETHFNDNSSAAEHSSGNKLGSNESLCSVDTYSIHTPENSMAADDLSCRGKDKHLNSKLQSQERNKTIKSPQEYEILSHKAVSKLKANQLVNEEEVGSKAVSEVTFVRLSDLDKEPRKAHKDIAAASIQRMSRSIPETSWIESKLLMTQSAGGRCSAMSSSSRSLSRLFPHLSTSGGSLVRSKTSSSCSPATEDIDIMRSSQVSDLSSMQSSVGMDYSTESTDISSGRGSPATQLGDDLLKMFIEEINPDVTVEVGGRRIKAHKCILSSRCQYFAAILSGGWVESAGNVISLQGFSYNCVHFALCHIYSGASNIPDHISIVELATLADMLCLEGLKEVIMYTLKVKYCHFFHKPCAVCSVGVLECLPLATAYGLDDIYRKSLRWITKYFVKIWPTKAFVALPRELIEKCYQQHIVHMNEENVLETIMCCDKLSATIPNLRWTEPVFSLTTRLLESCIKHMAENFSAVLASESFLSLGRDLPWNMNRLQESLASACDRLPPGQACRSYTRLCSVLNVAEGPNPPPEMSWHPNFVELLIKLRDGSERSLIRQAARAARTSAWGQMPLELRRKIQDAACLVLNPAEHATSRYRRSTSDGGATCAQRGGSAHSRNLDLRHLTMAMSQHARRSEQQPAPIRRANQAVSSLSKPGAPAAPQHAPPGRPKTWPAQVKSRYLEKRPTLTKPTVDCGKASGVQSQVPAPQRKTAIPLNKGLMISSSDSSRNSSPAMKRSIIATTSNSQSKTSDLKASSATAVTTGGRADPLSESSDQGNYNISGSRVKSPVRGKTQVKSLSKLPKTPPLRRKAETIIPVDLSGNGENETRYLVGNENITMSNDSLATHSSCEDCSMPHGEGELQEKDSDVVKHVIAKSASASHLNSEKRPDTRTPLTLANKKASPLIHQKKTPYSAAKPALSSPLSRRNGMQNPKLHNGPGPSSRLSIPLRTSASTSSVPDKNSLKANNSVDNLPNRKSIVKHQSRLQSIANAKHLPAGNGKSSSMSLAGRVSKSNKVNNNISRSCLSTNTDDKTNADPKGVNPGHPSVGPRSGTFLKDEPTVLNTSLVEGHPV